MGDFIELPSAVNAKLRYGFALNLTKHRGVRVNGLENFSGQGWITINAAKGWCLDEFGISNRWDYQHDVFMFAHVDDAMLFKLRWC